MTHTRAKPSEDSLADPRLYCAPMSDGLPIWRRWRESAVQAALVSGAVVLIAPLAFLIYVDYTSNAVRPYPPAIWRSALNALPVLVVTIPVTLLVEWRTYVHALAYRIRPIASWRGPLEAGAIAGGMALLLMLLMTVGTWARQPAGLVAAYIGFYVVATAVVGLLLGLLLAGVALLVLRISPREGRDALPRGRWSVVDGQWSVARRRRGDGAGRYVRSETVDMCSWIARSVGGGRRQADAEKRGSSRFRGATFRSASAPHLLIMNRDS